MKHWWVWVGVLLAGTVLLATVVGMGATSSTLWSTRYKLGDTIIFKVEAQNSCWWSCCGCSCGQPTCTDVQVLGWHVTDSTGNTIYSVVNDAPVSASIWEGSWAQVNSSGVAVSAGYYILYVDTSAGTLSRCLHLYDPCSCCWGWSCSACCQQSATITNCCCKTSLVFITETSTSCRSLFWWPCYPSCP